LLWEEYWPKLGLHLALTLDEALSMGKTIFSLLQVHNGKQLPHNNENNPHDSNPWDHDRGAC